MLRRRWRDVCRLAAHLLLVHFDLDLVPLLQLLHLPVLVAELGLAVLQLLFRDLPEGADLVSLQLEIVPLLALVLQLPAQQSHRLCQLLDTRSGVGCGCAALLTLALALSLSLSLSLSLVALALLLRRAADKAQSEVQRRRRPHLKLRQRDAVQQLPPRVHVPLQLGRDACEPGARSNKEMLFARLSYAPSAQPTRREPLHAGVERACAAPGGAAHPLGPQPAP
eukprot:scaffold10930_cov102-Isochrysis_galbana.AAC.3